MKPRFQNREEFTQVRKSMDDHNASMTVLDSYDESQDVNIVDVRGRHR